MNPWIFSFLLLQAAVLAAIIFIPRLRGGRGSNVPLFWVFMGWLLMVTLFSIAWLIIIFVVIPILVAIFAVLAFLVAAGMMIALILYLRGKLTGSRSR